MALRIAKSEKKTKHFKTMRNWRKDIAMQFWKTRAKKKGSRIKPAANPFCPVFHLLTTLFDKVEFVYDVCLSCSSEARTLVSRQAHVVVPNLN